MAKVPIKLNSKERHSMWLCKKSQWYVSLYSCFQCSHFEIFFDGRVDGMCGECIYPKRASKQSRVITRKFAAKVSGNGSSKKRVVSEGAAIKLKKVFIHNLIESGKDRNAIFVELHKKFLMSDNYCKTLYYQVKAEIKRRK